MRVDVVDAALEAAYGQAGRRPRIVLLTPSGPDASTTRSPTSSPPSRTWPCSAAATRGSTSASASSIVDDAVSIGRYVLAGGELAAMVVADAVLRKLPGALGHAESALEESFSEALGGAPEYPHYTRPPTYRGWGVPEVLLSGDHARHPGVAAAAQSRAPGRRRTDRSLLFPVPRGPTGTRAFLPPLRTAAADTPHEHDHREHREGAAAQGAALRRRRPRPRPLPGDRGHPAPAPRSSRAS